MYSNKESETVKIQTQVTIVIAIAIVTVAVLIALGKEPDKLVELLVVAIIPTVASIFGLQQAAKAKDAASEANENAQQAVHNTNGNTNRLLDILEQNGLERPDDYVGRYADEPDGY